jgi:acetyltransferase-like isoleucine patch superfamily enzyme/acyl carrier protein
VRSRATTVGAGLVVRGKPLVQNDGQLVIGDDVHVDSTPVRSHLVTGRDGRIAIGDRAQIGHGAAISAQRSVELHEDVVLGSYVTIMDTDFHVAGDAGRLAPSVPIVVEEAARIGHRVILLPGTSVGAGAHVLPGSVVSGAVPAGTTVSGNPAIPLGGRVEGASSVAAVVARVFQLAGPPGPELGPDDIAAWDSLGALRLLLALEATFSIVLDERQLAGVRDVAGLERAVAAAVA